MFDRVKKIFTNKSKSIQQVEGRPDGFYRQMPLAYTFYKGNSYDNTYPSIKAIVNKFIVIRPYAIDANGKPIENSNIINALYHPNRQMSATDFREALAVMSLVHQKVYLLLWRYEGRTACPGGKITESNFAGFTFLEGASEVIANNNKYYQCEGKTYNSNEVIEIFAGYDPFNLGKGYSPSEATKKWANVDDYIASYQAGFFENGAVPAGQFIITAKDSAQFNDIVAKMQSSHRGSGRNNNVIYSHRPLDPVTGSAMNAQIEWVPFSQTNKDMSLDSVFQQANDKIDSAFGVPASIRGVNDNNTYASVRVDEQIFIKYTVEPFATKIYTRLTHELNRVTGGLGYAITFDLDTPGIADEEKTEAEKKLTEFTIINQAMMSGYSLDSVVDAFNLSKSYKLLKQGYVPPVINNDKPEVDEGDEVKDSPDANKLGESEKSKSLVAKTDSSLDHCTCKHKEHVPTRQEQRFIDKVATVLKEHMNAQIERAIEDKAAKKDAEDDSKNEDDDGDSEDVNKTAKKILMLIVAYTLVRGRVTYDEGIQLLKDNNIPIDATTEFIVSDAIRDSYKVYLANVVKSYSKETASRIRDMLALAQANKLDKEQTAIRLRSIMNTDEWRVQRIAVTEEHRTTNNSSLYAMCQLMAETKTKIYKIWHTNSDNPCEFCKAMAGKRELVTNSFLPEGGSIVGADGGIFYNTFVDVEGANLHPNCHCYSTYEVER